MSKKDFVVARLRELLGPDRVSRLEADAAQRLSYERQVAEAQAKQFLEMQRLKDQILKK